MDNKWHNVYVTDKTGQKLWNASCSPMSTESEIRNRKRALDLAAKYPDKYPFLDLPTARIMVDDEPLVEMSDDELLAELGVA